MQDHLVNMGCVGRVKQMGNGMEVKAGDICIQSIHPLNQRRVNTAQIGGEYTGVNVGRNSGQLPARQTITPDELNKLLPAEIRTLRSGEANLICRIVISWLDPIGERQQRRLRTLPVRANSATSRYPLISTAFSAESGATTIGASLKSAMQSDDL
jgi:hypothetical protein